jgi:hypothetical protein
VLLPTFGRPMMTTVARFDVTLISLPLPLQGNLRSGE